MLFWQAQMAKQQDQTVMTKDWLARMEQEEVELKTKVRRLEMYLNNYAPTSIKELQVTEIWTSRSLTVAVKPACQHRLLQRHYRTLHIWMPVADLLAYTK